MSYCSKYFKIGYRIDSSTLNGYSWFSGEKEAQTGNKEALVPYSWEQGDCSMVWVHALHATFNPQHIWLPEHVGFDTQAQILEDALSTASYGPKLNKNEGYIIWQWFRSSLDFNNIIFYSWSLDLKIIFDFNIC